MKRLIASTALLAVLSLSAVAGDIPGSGKQDPPPEPTPAPITQTTPIEDTGVDVTILIEICLTLLGV